MLGSGMRDLLADEALRERLSAQVGADVELVDYQDYH